MPLKKIKEIIGKKTFDILQGSSILRMKKNECLKKIKIDDYYFDFFYKPGNDGNPVDLISMYKDIEYINESSGKNYKFGICRSFDDFKNMSKHIMISIFYNRDRKPIGFFYNYIQPHKDGFICHQGTFLCTEKTNIDILNIIGPLNASFIFDKIGKFYITTISQVPSVIEAITEHTTYSWPNPGNNKFVKRDFKEVFNVATREFKKIFLEDNEDIDIDERRFVVKILNNSHISSVKNIKQTSFAKKLEFNLFLDFWLNYEESEFLFLVSTYDKVCNLKNKQKLSYLVYFLNKKK